MQARTAKLIYITNTSLDGYIEDAAGDFNWVDPNEVQAFITDLIRPMRTYLYGRRVYETMAFWERPLEEFQGDENRNFAVVWQAAAKIVYSRTLTAPTTSRTRIEHEFDPEAVRKLKAESDHDLAIGGAELAGLALKAGLVDECQVFVNPVVVGGGKPAFPPGLRIDLQLLETHRFQTGVVYLRFSSAPRQAR